MVRNAYTAVCQSIVLCAYNLGACTALTVNFKRNCVTTQNFSVLITQELDSAVTSVKSHTLRYFRKYDSYVYNYTYTIEDRTGRNIKRYTSSLWRRVTVNFYPVRYTSESRLNEIKDIHTRLNDFRIHYLSSKISKKNNIKWRS